jgi:hypothetical protein
MVDNEGTNHVLQFTHQDTNTLWNHFDQGARAVDDYDILEPTLCTAYKKQRRIEQLSGGFVKQITLKQLKSQKSSIL